MLYFRRYASVALEQERWLGSPVSLQTSPRCKSINTALSTEAQQLSYRSVWQIRSRFAEGTVNVL